jgi:hypothetical protein
VELLAAENERLGQLVKKIKSAPSYAHKSMLLAYYDDAVIDAMPRGDLLKELISAVDKKGSYIIKSLIAIKQHTTLLGMSRAVLRTS